MTIRTRETHRCFGGQMGFYVHDSVSTGTEMRFSVFVPPQASQRRVPALYYLPGLTCTEETFFIKAGAQRLAAELGLLLVSCDTSPRGLELPGESEAWDFGAGAGFYLDATVPPWDRHYRMASYVGAELPRVIEADFPALAGRRGIMGHSMGGHGALVTGLRDPRSWQSVSAIAPIANPTEVPWGQKAFAGYLGPDRTAWQEWDACWLVRRRPYPGPILIDQGSADQFLEFQLRPGALEAAAHAAGQELRINLHEGYDHSYWFVQSVIGDHLHHHATLLNR